LCDLELEIGDGGLEGFEKFGFDFVVGVGAGGFDVGGRWFAGGDGGGELERIERDFDGAFFLFRFHLEGTIGPYFSFAS
jgi:hypothetical protein